MNSSPRTGQEEVPVRPVLAGIDRPSGGSRSTASPGDAAGATTTDGRHRAGTVTSRSEHDSAADRASASSRRNRPRERYRADGYRPADINLDTSYAGPVLVRADLRPSDHVKRICLYSRRLSAAVPRSGANHAFSGATPGAGSATRIFGSSVKPPDRRRKRLRPSLGRRRRNHPQQQLSFRRRSRRSVAEVHRPLSGGPLPSESVG